MNQKFLTLKNYYCFKRKFVFYFVIAKITRAKAIQS